MFALVARTVLLIDKYRISDVVHDDILKMHVGGNALRGSRPCFHSDSVHGVC